MPAVCLPTQWHFIDPVDLKSINNDFGEVTSLKAQKQMAGRWRELSGREAQVCETIEEAINFIKADSLDKRVRVLVTGSLHLIGGVMTVLGVPSL